MQYELLDAFEGLFQGKVFNHRISTQGDYVAIHFFEDLYNLNRSVRYVSRVAGGTSVVNRQNRAHGVVARRGDGSFGELIPGETPQPEGAFVVKRGPIARIEIGIEVKIVQKAMIRQIDRVINDLNSQVKHFKAKKGSPITVGVVGVNRAPYYVSYEGSTSWPTTGKGRHKHPFQEADEAIARLKTLAAPSFDEFLILEFSATNVHPFPFSWVDSVKTRRDYASILVRVSNAY